MKDTGSEIILSSWSLPRQKGKDKQGEGGTFSELFASKCSDSSSKASVLDIGAGSHISSSLEDLENERKLRLGEVTLSLLTKQMLLLKL